MFFGCRGYPASIWHKYPGKWYHCSRTVAGCWSWYKQSCVGGVLLEESRKPVRFYEIFLHQQLLLSFITACSLLPSTCNKQIRPCSFSVHAFLNAIYAIFYNCSEGVECNDAVSDYQLPCGLCLSLLLLFLGLMRNSHWCYSQLLFWSSFYTIWCWTHLTGTDTCFLLCISIKK